MDEVTRERLWELLTGLIDTVEKAAPVVWDMAIRQAIVEGLTSAIVGLVLIGMAIWAYKTAPKLFLRSQEMKANDRWSDHEVPFMGAIVCYGFALSGIFGGFVALTKAIGPLVNPGYYAIKLLVELASGAPLP